MWISTWLTIAVVLGWSDWEQAVLIAALAALSAVEACGCAGLLSGPGRRGWGGCRGRGHLVNQYGLCVTRGRSCRSGGKTVSSLSLFKRCARTVGLRALRQHDLDAGLGGRRGIAACAVYGFFVRWQCYLNALHHDGSRLSWHTLFPAALEDRQREGDQILTWGLHHRETITQLQVTGTTEP